MKEYISNSKEETVAIAKSIVPLLSNHDIIFFDGGLGMGKTAFCQGLCDGLGIKATVTSPTFAIVNDYGGNPPLVHFDMYKVESWEDLYSSGYYDYMDMGAVLCVEWSENIENALPDDVIRVTINRGDGENERIITIEGLEI